MQFTHKVLAFIVNQAQYFLSAQNVKEQGSEVDESKRRLRMLKVCEAMQSLRNVLRANQGKFH